MKKRTAKSMAETETAERKSSKRKKTDASEVTMPVESESAVIEAVPIAKRRVGRKPMTEEEKAAFAIQRAERKAKAANMVPSIILQYQGADTDLARLAEAAKADFKAIKKRTPITDLKLYLKPEDGAVYL